MAATSPGCGRSPAPPVAVAPDAGDAQRLVALVEYVAADYGLAVADGTVVSAFEYEEQLRFVADVRQLASRLLGPEAAADDALLRRIADLEARVGAKAPAAEVREACRSARDLAVERLRIRTSPTQRPDLRRAETLYAQSCAVCHGARGEADTERARSLDPPPVRFTDAERLEDLSPYRAFNALTFGVPGTAMAAFDALSAEERWDLAFYVLRLGHAGRESRGPVALSLAEMATRTDGELRAVLEAEGVEDAGATLTHSRLEAAFTEPPAEASLARTRRMTRDAQAAFLEGRREDADRLAIDAYLSGFEPLEPRLSARDPGQTLAVEAAFRDLRAAIHRGDPSEVRSRGATLDGLLRDLGGRRTTVPFVAALVIYLREGIEAALLVGALLAGLRRLGRPEASRWIHAGWLLALPAGILTWWAFERVVALGAEHRELIEAGVALLAAAVLFSVSFWLISKADSRQWIAYLRRRLEEGLSRGQLSVLAGLAFLAVYREAAETVLFTQALLLEAGEAQGRVWAGAATGLVLVAAAAAVMNRAAGRLPLGPFFAASGVLLCGLAISFAGSGIYDLVAAGYLPPRPVPFPEVAWLGIHPDLTGLLVQLAIVLSMGAAIVLTNGRLAEARARRRS